MPFVAAFGVALLTALMVKHDITDPGLRAMIAALVVFIPGVALTTAFLELTEGQMVAGSSRLVWGGTQLGLLAFGIVAGISAVGVPAGACLCELRRVLGSWAPWLGVLVFAVGVTVAHSTPPGAIPSLLVVLYAAWTGQVIGNALFGGYASGFVGAVVMTLVAYLLARLPSTMPVYAMFLPGFWLLVPGSLGLIGLTTILATPDAGFERRHLRRRRIDRGGGARRPLRGRALPLADGRRAAGPGYYAAREASCCLNQEPPDHLDRPPGRRRGGTTMCRWLAYSGSPIRLEELLVKRDRSLIDQSLHSRLGATTTNGDGFGVGWYDDCDTPRLYRSVHPAWNDRNLRELAAGISSRLFLAHIRASTGTAIQETNAHPFRYGRWLWMHNGLIREFPRIRRELVLAVDESLFASIEGTTDSETMFYLALTFGLESDPIGAVEQMVGFVEETGRRHGIEHPIQMTIGTTDGRSVYAFRYSSERATRSLYFSTRMDALKALHPEVEELAGLSDETRVVVSEPLGDLAGAWNEVPESHVGIIQPGDDELRPFAPLH